MNAAALILSVTLGAAPATRVAVLLDDSGPGAPTTAALEAKLQQLGYEVVAAETSERMRKVVAPQALLGSRLPEGLSVFEADAILGGTVSYGEPVDMEGVKSIPVSLTVRLIDLGTGQTTATIRSQGVGVGAGGPMVVNRAVDQSIKRLFGKRGLKKELAKVGQTAGSVTLVVQNLPDRDAFMNLQDSLRKATAGAPIKEIYYAKGLGKIVLGGSKSNKSMVGPDVANLISEHKQLSLRVDEVANTRIVARFDPSRSVRVHALVLEPRVKGRKQANELGKYVATQLATFDYARASYQRGRLNRKVALRRAKEIGANVVIESEVLGTGKSAAFTLRVIDVSTGRPIHREQKVLEASGSFGAAETLVSNLQSELPPKLVALAAKHEVSAAKSDPTASKE